MIELRLGLLFVPSLTVLDHADEGDDDQEVDVFHHFHIHDLCVSCSGSRMTKRPRERPSVSSAIRRCVFAAKCRLQT